MITRLYVHKKQNTEELKEHRTHWRFPTPSPLEATRLFSPDLPAHRPLSSARGTTEPGVTPSDPMVGSWTPPAMLTLYLPSCGPSTSWEKVWRKRRAQEGALHREQLGTGEHGMRAPSPGPHALTAWVARGGGTLITALGVGEHCRQRETELNGIAGSDLF